MTETEKAENAKSLALSLRANNPVLSYDTSQRIASDLIESSDGWLPWKELSKYTSLPIVIVGRDCLGYVHNATHLIGGDGQWVEEWKQVSV